MKSHSVINFLIFTCFLVIGYTFSLRFYQPGEVKILSTVKIVAAESHGSIQSLDNGQRSLLLISASRLDALDPKLEGVWLATYLPAGSNVQLFPIFPRGDESLSVFERELESSFLINSQGSAKVIDQGFFSVLEKNNYWWSGYFLFDEVSLIGLVNQFGGVDLNGKSLSGEQTIGELHTAWDTPRAAYSAQIALLQSLCHELSLANAKINLLQVQAMIPDHLLTDLDSDQLQAEYYALNSNNHNPTCRFPTLEVSRIGP